MTNALDPVIEDVSALHREITEHINSFEAAAGYSCRAGCGQCCLKPTVEAQVVDMLPMARYFIELGIADRIYDRALEHEDDACILYEAVPGNPEMGLCGNYSHRPSLCRLFGFAAVNKKSGPPELAPCQWHKKLYPDQVKAVQEKINSGAQVPLFSDYTMRIRSLAPTASLESRHLINRALRVAIETLMLARQFSDAALPEVVVSELE